MVKANTKSIQKNNSKTAAKRHTATWTPAAIRKATKETAQAAIAEVAQEIDQPIDQNQPISDQLTQATKADGLGAQAITITALNRMAQAIVSTLPDETAPEPKPKDKPPVTPLSSHGPDAARLNPQAPPELIAARLVVAEMIRNPPRYANGLVGSVPMLFDRHMAQAFIERNHKNRNPNDPRIRQHARTFLTNKWRGDNGETVKVSKSGILLDAQHRILGFLRACETKPDLTAWMDVRFDLDDDVFDTIDTGMPRTIGHSLGIRGYKNVIVLGAATRLLMRYHSPGGINPTSRIDNPTTVEVEDAIEKYPLVVEGANRAQVFRRSGLTPTVCAFLWALAADYNRDLAETFFEQLVTGENLTKDSPALRLRNISSQGGSRTSIQQAALGIKAWNAFVAGKPVRALAWREDGPARETFPVAVAKPKAEADLLNLNALEEV